MNDQKKYDTQEPKESLHWISYNVKKIAAALEHLCGILTQIQKGTNIQSERKNDDIPF